MTCEFKTFQSFGRALRSADQYDPSIHNIRRKTSVEEYIDHLREMGPEKRQAWFYGEFKPAEEQCSPN